MHHLHTITLCCSALFLFMLTPLAAMAEVRGEVVSSGVYSTVTSGTTEYYNEMTNSDSVIDEVTDVLLIYDTDLVVLRMSEKYEFGYEYRITGCKDQTTRVTFYTRQDGRVIDRWSDDTDCNEVLYWGWNDWDAIRSNWRMGSPVTFGAEHYGAVLFEFQTSFQE